MATAVESPPLNRTDDALTPTASHFSLPPRPSDKRALSDASSSITPTKESFAAAATTISAPPPPPPSTNTEKRPLPQDKPADDTRDSTSPATTTSPAAQDTSPAPPPHEDGDEDVKMEDRKDDELDGSDNDDNVDEDGRPTKKKRSQRFFCTEYPPCNLSFTRSEHLARHIRKHTGERPFQCHCLRRFSRLDNLRQHAQTVHLNEDIPGDSLAATGTRYQRQVRTERIRPAGHRQRASTLSAGTHSRGHSRNVSSSSIGSVSDFGSPEDPRRRPQPLLMAPSTPPRPTGGDSYGAQAGPPPYYNYPHSGYSTPSAYSAADPTSPRMSAGLGSPIALMPRSTIGWGGQNSSRRLSIPSGVSPYHAPHAFAMPPASPFVSQVAYPPAVPYPGPPGHPPTHYGHSRHESLESAEADWRRRTWHASTRSNVESRPATSALTYHQRPDDPQPVSTAQPAAQQAVRLPGIDSFDRPQMQPVSRARRLTNDMEVEESSQAGDDASSKRNSWSSMHQNLHQLELTQNTPPRESNYWRHSTGSQPSSATTRPMTAPHNGYAQPPQELVGASGAERPSTPKRQKRAADWSYEAALADGDGGPGPAVRTSPEGSSNSDELPTPGTSAAEYRPAIVHSNGYVEGQPGGILEDPSKAQEVHRNDVAGYAPIRTPLQAEAPKPHEDTGRLDALVAVATSEERALSRQ